MNLTKYVYFFSILLACLMILSSCQEQLVPDGACPDDVIVEPDGSIRSGIDIIGEPLQIAASNLGGINSFNPRNPREILAMKSIANEERTEFIRQGIGRYNLDTHEFHWVYDGPSWATGGWSMFDEVSLLYNDTLYLISIYTGEIRRFTDRPGRYYSGATSPDGLISLIRGLDDLDGGKQKIFLFNHKGEFIKFAPDHLLNVFRGGSWSEDNIIVSSNLDTPPGADGQGQDLVFISYPGFEIIKRIQLIGTDIAPHSRGFSGFVWKPNTRKVIWSDNRGILYETDFDTEESRVIYGDCNHGIVGSFRLAPDGEHVIINVSEFEHWTDREKRKVTNHIHQINLDTGEETRIHTFPQI